MMFDFSNSYPLFFLQLFDMQHRYLHKIKVFRENYLKEIAIEKTALEKISTGFYPILEVKRSWWNKAAVSKNLIYLPPSIDHQKSGSSWLGVFQIHDSLNSDILLVEKMLRRIVDVAFIVGGALLRTVSSIIFLFIFLPCFLAFYLFCFSRWKQIVDVSFNIDWKLRLRNKIEKYFEYYSSFFFKKRCLFPKLENRALQKKLVFLPQGLFRKIGRDFSFSVQIELGETIL